ncbi:MAG: 16S rRNA (adenine(1518)-N(6)/adenine(1519)-N(6))-dimethyltransferase RsmA [Rhodospirillaceae bacterium]
MKPRRRFGQHFLDAAWSSRVLEAAAFGAKDQVIEIGPGRGALTVALASAVGRLTAVEIDRDLVPILRGRLPAHVRVVEGDFLDVPADVLFEGGSPEPWRVVGNLPYNVSSPILFRLLELARSGGRLRDATLMLQREVADRIASPPGTKSYGALSILVQLDADVEPLLTLPPGAFRPPPEVWSSVIRLHFRPPRFAVRDRRGFETLVRSLFSQRRKMLANSLRPAASSRGRLAADVLREAGIDPARRPETLHLEELAGLVDVLDAGNSGGVV